MMSIGRLVMETMIRKFKKGTSYVNIVSAVTEAELTRTSSIKDDYMTLNCLKFIPASGAATRMFMDLFKYLEDGKDHPAVTYFMSNLEDFAFYEELASYLATENLDKESVEGRQHIIDALLNHGLNYGNLPKALLKFHKYGEQTNTPIDEHIFEGESYLGKDHVDLHFTISKEHESLFNKYIDIVKQGKTNLSTSYSFQKPETDTLAVDMNNEPFKLDKGQYLYRPGGHGSLIENLNDLEADIVFIKNIDNVCHQNKAKDTIDSKKLLATIGYETKTRIDQYIEGLLSEDYLLAEIKTFLQETLNINYKGDLTKDIALNFLDRPLRVCGMVKNQGEPGGGPFVVDNGDYTDLQICEKAEIDLENEAHCEILKGSTYFNPVDLVCFIKNYKGHKYDLIKYVNQDRYFISEKSYKGRRLKALEHPGLWNGAMHNWNTIFVEVPLTTFNPVKTVNDLLRDGHKE